MRGGRVIEIYRLVKAVAPGIEVDYFEVFAYGPWSKCFPWNLECDLADRGCFELGRKTRVKSEATQPTKWRVCWSEGGTRRGRHGFRNLWFGRWRCFAEQVY